MMEQNIAEFEYLALVVNYNEFLGRTILKKEYFSSDKNKILFGIIKNEYDEEKVLNFSKLNEHKDFDFEYYDNLLNNNKYTSGREKQFKILEKKIIEQFKDRILKKVIGDYNGDLEDFYKKVEKIKELNIQENEYITSEDMIRVLEEDKAQIKLGFTDLDKVLYISQTDFVILAGGTGTGKTTFALNLLSNLSKEYQCVYFNMEMSKKTLYKRLAAIETGIEITKFNNIGELQEKEAKLLYSKIASIEERKIIIVNNSQTIENIEKVISSINDERKIVVILDHIGLINGEGTSLYEKMTNIAKKIRAICLDYDCTIFGLCQLSRESQKEDRRPKLQDLRDSGEIEQSARKVLLLYNKDARKQNDIKDVEILVAKNDDGSCIVEDFKFNTLKQRFGEVGNNG